MSSNGKILIVDDERAIRNSLKEILEDEEYEVEVAPDASTALQLVEGDHFQAVLCDIKMPGMDGVELLTRLHEKVPDTAIVMMTGHGDIDTAVDCIRKGAYDFLTKPLDLNRTLITIKNALDKTQLVGETKILKKKVYNGDDMVGESEGMQALRDMVEKVAPTDARVLITGQNGTGKELV
ncbi:MAG: sigma-54-dependent Fis family transcriptional regulator, partial [Bacteroidales bacterium]|nr:sigma-54-dependent Fis family transcriptional regulator [Bacteroidales bacterium]